MTAKEYLMQYRGCINRVHAIGAHLNELRAIANQLRTEDGHSIALDAAVAELVDTERRTESEIAQLLQAETSVVCTIERIPEPYRTLLYERYINGRTWEQVAVMMNYSYRGVMKMHGRALQAVKECIEVHTASVL